MWGVCMAFLLLGICGVRCTCARAGKRGLALLEEFSESRYPAGVMLAAGTAMLRQHGIPTIYKTVITK